MNSNTITHDGVIEEITDQKLYIRLSRLPACADCHARGICSVTESNGGEIMITEEVSDVLPGDKVTVSISQSTGFRALLIAYVWPFLLVILTMTFMSALHVQEWLTGLSAIGVLVPYYLWFRFRKRALDKAFRFQVRKRS